MKSILLRLLSWWICLQGCAVLAVTERLDLSGLWGFQMDPTEFEIAFENSGAHRDALRDQVTLPGTTDTNRKGVPTTGRPINRLSRLFEYSGPAWYQKDIVIPPTWDGKAIELRLERVLWISAVYVDGSRVGSARSFSTPHVYDLSPQLSPGSHRLTICVDNRVPASFDRWSHAFSEYTQTAWNGLVGEISLTARDLVHLADLQVYPEVSNRTARVKIKLANPDAGEVRGEIALSAEAAPGGAASARVPFTGSGPQIEVEGVVSLGDNAQFWDEFAPRLYTLKAELAAQSGQTRFQDSRQTTFGLRQYTGEGAHFAINGRPVFLRGTLECAVFPLTGYPDMMVAGWERIFRIARSYGLNHLRFHSWCPPEAAFAAADQAGFYLQIELPCWTEVGKDADLDAFLRQEMDAILRHYGNHPSFAQLCMGNELRGNFEVLAALVRHGRETDPRHLYSGATARQHLPEDQFYVSHQTSAGGITTYGARGPQTDYDLRKAYAVLKVPGVAHEVGQRAVYPNFDEIPKYIGVLYPRNFEVFREALDAHGMRDQAGDFFRVSGQMTAFLYKESIEALLRTPNCGGFQLLDLHDFPGQGTALVGLLDPFWDSKGMIAPEQFREFCGSTVPLLRLPKRTYYDDETLTGSAELFHYGAAALAQVAATWTLATADGRQLAAGQFAPQTIVPGSLAALGNISTPLSVAGTSQKLALTLQAGSFKNSWDLWVYPRNPVAPATNDYVITRTEADTVAALNQGKRVLVLPDIQLLEGKNADFQNHFWCPIMFRWEPMTMGTLIQNRHPVFRDFATEFYPNWQWWEIISQARILDLDHTPREFRPLAQVIDTYDRCLKEGVLFEARVGSGQLLMAAIDFDKNLARRPAARQLLLSLQRYAGSAEFKPQVELPLETVRGFFKKPSLLTGAKVIRADSYEKGNEPEKAIDDDPNTIWHTSYFSAGTLAVTSREPETDYPHELQIELAKETEFAGFSCLPRADGVNGYIAQYEFYATDNPADWGAPIAQGSFPRNAKLKTVKFEKPVKARYIRLVARKGFEGQKWASLAELRLLPTP